MMTRLKHLARKLQIIHRLCILNCNECSDIPVATLSVAMDGDVMRHRNPEAVLWILLGFTG